MDSMAFNLVFQVKCILKPWCMLFQFAKVFKKKVGSMTSFRLFEDMSFWLQRLIESAWHSWKFLKKKNSIQPMKSILIWENWSPLPSLTLHNLRNSHWKHFQYYLKSSQHTVTREKRISVQEMYFWSISKPIFANFSNFKFLFQLMIFFSNA